MKKFEFNWLRRWSLLEYLIGVYKIKKFVEIGTYNGEIGKRLLREKTIKLDLYLMIDVDIKPYVLQFGESHPGVKTVQAPSSEAAKQIEDGSMDLIFVDGDHSYEGCKSDIILYTLKLRKGGWMLVHDYHSRGGNHHPGVKKAVDELWGEDFYYIPDESFNGPRWIVFKQF